MNLSTVTDKQLKFIEDKLNNRPRKILGFRTPNEGFDNLVNVALQAWNRPSMKQPARLTAANFPRNPDARFQLLNRWSFLLMQLNECRALLDLAQTSMQARNKPLLPEYLTKQALFKSFLLSYGKCFASSGKGRSSLDSTKVFSAAPHLLPIHGRIMDLRHKYGAHNDTSGLDEAFVDVVEYSDRFVIAHRYAAAYPVEEFDNYRGVATFVYEHAVDQINRALDSLEVRLQKPIDVIGNEA